MHSAGLVGRRADRVGACRSLSSHWAPTCPTPVVVARDLGIADGGAVLVRPDGHVSWRTTSVPGDREADLVAAIATTLG